MTEKKNILEMETRGCPFFEPHSSDIGNYRITTKEYLPLRDGRKMFFEFSICDHYNYRTTNKRTGAPLKKPVRELVKRDVAHVSTCYPKQSIDGGYICFRDLKMEANFWAALLPYTLKTVLDFINFVSATHYDGITFV